MNHIRGYTDLVRRLLAPVCVALLTVLAGTPLVAIVCAEWCDTSGSSAVHRGHNASMPAETPDCHGGPTDGPRVGGDAAPECQTDGVVDGLAAVVTARHDTVPPVLMPAVANVPVDSPGLTPAQEFAASPPDRSVRPAPSNLVLRI